MVSADVIGRLCLWNYHLPRSPVVVQWSGHSDCINRCILLFYSTSLQSLTFISIAGGAEGRFVTAGNDKVLRVWDVCQAGARGNALQELQGIAITHKFIIITNHLFIRACKLCTEL
jgi:hypothetical protein